MAWYRCVGGAGGSLKLRTASGRIATFETNIETAFVSLKSDINPVQSGTGTPSPQNVRPISGFSALNVTRTGKNLFDKNSITGSSYIDTDGTIRTTLGFCVSDYIPVAVGNYIASQYAERGSGVYLAVFDTNKNIVRTVQMRTGLENTTLVTIGANEAYIRMSVKITQIDTAQFENGNQATAYEPYNGQTATVNFGQTVYGGVADVTNGKVTITHLIKRIDDLNWYYNSTYAFFSTGISDLIDGYSELEIKSSAFESIYVRSNANMADAPNYTINHLNTTIKVKDTDYTDANAFKTALANETIWYKLATPIEITTTPENLTAIVGQNNVYSDTNGDTEVKYLYRG